MLFRSSDHIDLSKPMIREASADTVREALDKMLNDVHHKHDSIVIHNDDGPVVALVDIGLFERIRAMEDRGADRGLIPGIASRVVW